MKPGAFINESGRSVRAPCSFFKLGPEAILWYCTTSSDLTLGELCLKAGGGDRGNRRLRSISRELAAAAYGRLRLGIGRPPPDFVAGVTDFVLQAFALEERSELPSVLERACEAVKFVISDGLFRATNRTNQRTVR